MGIPLSAMMVVEFVILVFIHKKLLEVPFNTLNLRILYPYLGFKLKAESLKLVTAPLPRKC